MLRNAGPVYAPVVVAGLSPDDINHVLDLADGYVEPNRQAEKKRNTLRVRTIINCFFESSTRTYGVPGGRA